jgi:formiminotetrahydrofolate cyclodeaminase
MMADQNMKEFIEVLSSKEPVPGGGGASAYAGAIGMALGNMVANLTTGKKKYAQYQEEIDEVLITAARLSDELLAFMDKDAESFKPLAKAYGLPKDTPEQIELKESVMENALYDASETPLQLMSKVLETMKVLERLSVIGSRLAISDVGVGIQMAKAALNGASLNVFINTKLMKNREKADSYDHRADIMLIEGNDLADQIYDTVMDAIR